MIGAQLLGTGGVETSLGKKGGILFMRDYTWNYLRDQECRLKGKGEASWGRAVETLNARLRGGEVFPVNFHFWPGCPWLAPRSSAAPPQSGAASFLTCSIPLWGVLSEPLLGVISARPSGYSVGQFSSSNSEVSPREGQAGWQVAIVEGVKRHEFEPQLCHPGQAQPLSEPKFLSTARGERR